MCPYPLIVIDTFFFVALDLIKDSFAAEKERLSEMEVLLKNEQACMKDEKENYERELVFRKEERVLRYKKEVFLLNHLLEREADTRECGKMIFSLQLCEQLCRVHTIAIH